MYVFVSRTADRRCTGNDVAWRVSRCDFISKQVVNLGVHTIDKAGDWIVVSVMRDGRDEIQLLWPKYTGQDLLQHSGIRGNDMRILRR